MNLRFFIKKKRIWEVDTFFFLPISSFDKPFKSWFEHSDCMRFIREYCSSFHLEGWKAQSLAGKLKLLKEKLKV